MYFNDSYYFRLGFLTTLDQSAMGNLGLLDITQALLWIQDNIASFYGDPEKITLFGHGHGAALVNLLLLSPFVSGMSELHYFNSLKIFSTYLVKQL